jgi:hypothetical protein
MLSRRRTAGQVRSSTPFAGADMSWWGNEYAAIAVDGSNRPHLAYVAQGDSGGLIVRYAVMSGTTWLSTTMGAGAYPALALDHHGHPHLAYAGWDDGIAPLHYTWYDGSVWQTEDVVTSSVDAVTLALDSSDMPHLGYTMFGYGDAAEIHLCQAHTAGLAPASCGHRRLGHGGSHPGSPRPAAHGLSRRRSLEIRSPRRRPVGNRAAGPIHAGQKPPGGGSRSSRPAARRLLCWRSQEARCHLRAAGRARLGDNAGGANGIQCRPGAGSGRQSAPDLPQRGQCRPALCALVAGADPAYARHAYAYEIAPGEPFSLSIGLQGSGQLAAWRMPIPAGTTLVAGSLSGAGSYAPDENAVIWAGRLPTATLQMTHLQLELTAATQDVPVVVSTVYHRHGAGLRRRWGAWLSTGNASSCRGSRRQRLERHSGGLRGAI